MISVNGIYKYFAYIKYINIFFILGVCVCEKYGNVLYVLCISGLQMLFNNNQKEMSRVASPQRNN